MKQIISVNFTKWIASLCTVLILSLTSCVEEPYVSWIIDNRTEDAFLLFYGYNDFEVKDAMQASNNNLPRLVLPNESYEFAKVYAIDNKRTDYINFIIITENTFAYYGIEEIANNNIYDAKFTLSWEEFKEMDWAIVYTGQESKN